MKTEEVRYTRILKSPRLAPTVILEANWQIDWNSDAAASISSQPIQPTDQPARTGQPVIVQSRAEIYHENMLENV